LRDWTTWLTPQEMTAKTKKSSRQLKKKSTKGRLNLKKAHYSQYRGKFKLGRLLGYQRVPTSEYNISQLVPIYELDEQTNSNQMLLALFPDMETIISDSGREIINADQAFKDHFIDLLKNGMTKAIACLDCGITISRLNTFFKIDPDFKRLVNTIEASRDELVEMILFDAAMNKDVAAASAFLGRRDRIRSMQESNRAKRSELALKKRVVDIQANIGNAPMATNVGALSDDELASYDKLCSIVSNGTDLSDQQVIEFGLLNAKIHKVEKRDYDPLYELPELEMK
jgi:hypothetical protein